MSLSGNLRVSASFTNTKEGVDLSTPTESVAQSISAAVSAGVLYHALATLSSLEVLALDFGNDSLSDVFGDTIDMATVTSIYVKAGADNTVDLTITDGANSMLNEQPPMGAGEGIGFALSIDASTDAKLYITNGAAESTVEVIVTGTE